MGVGVGAGVGVGCDIGVGVGVGVGVSGAEAGALQAVSKTEPRSSPINRHFIALPPYLPLPVSGTLS